MSDINDIPCVPAQLLEEVRAYLDKYYEEPEELFDSCLMPGEDYSEEADGEYFEDLDECAFEEFDEGIQDESCAKADEDSSVAPLDSFRSAEKSSKPRFFGGSKKSAARESIPDESRNEFVDASADAFKAPGAGMPMAAQSMMGAAAVPLQSSMNAAAKFSAGAAAQFSAGAAAQASAGAAAQARKLEDVIGDLDKSFMEMVYEFADRKGITDPELQKKAGIDRKAYSKLKCGTSKNPSKSTALALAIALELSLDDTKDLLSRAGLALSPCSRQDLIVRYFIEKEIYDMFVINYTLDEYGEQPLGAH